MVRKRCWRARGGGKKRGSNPSEETTGARHVAAREVLKRIRELQQALERGDGGGPGNVEQVHRERWESGDPEREECAGK